MEEAQKSLLRPLVVANKNSKDLAVRMQFDSAINTGAEHLLLQKEPKKRS